MTVFELRQMIESRIQVWHVAIVMLMAINVAIFVFIKRRWK